jgi:uncharacterized protein YdhG (YjbR/CyaY superfamily)
MQKVETVEAYIALFDTETQVLLNQIRQTIKQNAPNAIEGIGYGMPSYKLNGVLAYFGAFANHVSLFPSGSGIIDFKDRLDGLTYSKGAIQFQKNKPLPIDLIADIIVFRVKQNEQKELLKAEIKAAKKEKGKKG